MALFIAESRGVAEYFSRVGGKCVFAAVVDTPFCLQREEGQSRRAKTSCCRTPGSACQTYTKSHLANSAPSPCSRSRDVQKSVHEEQRDFAGQESDAPAEAMGQGTPWPTKSRSTRSSVHQAAMQHGICLFRKQPPCPAARACQPSSDSSGVMFLYWSIFFCDFVRYSSCPRMVSISTASCHLAIARLTCPRSSSTRPSR